MSKSNLAVPLSIKALLIGLSAASELIGASSLASSLAPITLNSNSGDGSSISIVHSASPMGPPATLTNEMNGAALPPPEGR